MKALLVLSMPEFIVLGAGLLVYLVKVLRREREL